MNVTILTDASFCPNTKAAGYGGWIASDRGKTMVGGAFKTSISCSEVAELAAVANVVSKATRLGLILPEDHLLIQVDCLRVINVTMGWSEPYLVGEADIHKYLVGLLSEFSTYRFKHVKAHTSGYDKRTRSNNHCDLEAKRHMKAVRLSRKTVNNHLT